MSAIRITALVAAALATGLIAGVFYAYAISVMPAFARMDDRMVIEVMQKINIVIINPAFMVGFLGMVGFTLLAAVLHLGSRPTLWWIGIALVLNLVAFGITAGCNVPLNDQLAAAGDPATLPDPEAVRAAFEPGWVRWNIVRSVLHGLAFLVLCAALFAAGVQSGREPVRVDSRSAGMVRTDVGIAAYDRSHR
ncbi:anthrone oxygenase family protein [Nocardia brevicatena]|uniref:anthrone oxygenase family protein n=1 Tax=Nocardia brevicatena TaxID=37327 RepID=UPI0003038ECD|nr:anthrone oxygenase family protein [Nocardia brevicatena]